MQLTILRREMERKSFSDMHCSVAQALEIVGEWWSLLIVRDAFLGVSRFDDFQARLGISRNVLGQRLAHLVDSGVLQKVPYNSHPPRYDYRLTDKGRDLWPVLTTLRQWGDRYAAPDGPPLELVHRDCGATSEAVLVCSACGEEVGARDVRAVAGPGAVEPLLAGTAAVASAAGAAARARAAAGAAARARAAAGAAARARAAAGAGAGAAAGAPGGSA
jgi:DNA-binding HxlR family transcriptional regulator